MKRIYLYNVLVNESILNGLRPTSILFRLQNITHVHLPADPQQIFSSSQTTRYACYLMTTNMGKVEWLEKMKRKAKALAMEIAEEKNKTYIIEWL